MLCKTVPKFVRQGQLVYFPLKNPIEILMPADWLPDWAIDNMDLENLSDMSSDLFWIIAIFANVYTNGSHHVQEICNHI